MLPPETDAILAFTSSYDSFTVTKDWLSPITYTCTISGSVYTTTEVILLTLINAGLPFLSVSSINVFAAITQTTTEDAFSWLDSILYFSVFKGARNVEFAIFLRDSFYRPQAFQSFYSACRYEFFLVWR